MSKHIKVFNSVTGKEEFVSPSELKESKNIEQKTDKNGNVYIVRKGANPISQTHGNAAQGCFITFAIAFTLTVVAGCSLLVAHEYKTNHKQQKQVSKTDTINSAIYKWNVEEQIQKFKEQQR